MAPNNQYYSRSKNRVGDPGTPDTYDYSGLYIGFVKDNKDVQKMGRIRVWIPEFAADPDDADKWVQCEYCSPFAGASNINYEKTGSQVYTESQQSYGWWAIPPDLENEVFVMFLNGRQRRGIWIGCKYQQNMNHMVPGIASNRTFPSQSNPNFPVVPVSEYNKKDQTIDPNAPIRPTYQPLYQGLMLQGLLGDGLRGYTNASARRESPSQVYGLKSPSGHQIYIDDGQATSTRNDGSSTSYIEVQKDPNVNEYIRLRTKSGTQVLINDTTGFVYINSKNGSSWFEISESGIDAFTENSISLRCLKDFNLKVDGNYNLFVNQNFNMWVNGTSNINLAGDVNWTNNGNLFLTTDKDLNIISGGLHNQTSFGDMNLLSEGDITESANNIHLNTDGKCVPATEATQVKLGTYVDHALNRTTYPPVQGTTLASMTRVPTHEPWEGHPTGNPGTNTFEENAYGAGQTPVAPNGAPNTTSFGTGDGGTITTTNGQIPKGALQAGATKPADIVGSPMPGDPPGYYQGVGYDANGNPEYKFLRPLNPGEAMDPKSLTISDNGLDLIKQKEGFSATVYNDAGGKPTIGYGHLLTPQEQASGTIMINGQAVPTSGGLTMDQATQLLRQDSQTACASVSNNTKVPLTQDQYDALASFTYNVGPNAYKNSTLLNQLNQGNYNEVGTQMMSWNKVSVGGQLVPNQGLTARRTSEANLFNSGTAVPAPSSTG